VRGSFHMGECKLNTSRGIRLAQCSTVEITWISDAAIPAQVDGEPWEQPPSKLKIRFWNQGQMLKKVVVKKTFFNRGTSRENVIILEDDSNQNNNNSQIKLNSLFE